MTALGWAGTFVLLVTYVNLWGGELCSCYPLSSLCFLYRLHLLPLLLGTRTSAPRGGQKSDSPATMPMFVSTLQIEKTSRRYSIPTGKYRRMPLPIVNPGNAWNLMFAVRASVQ